MLRSMVLVSTFGALGACSVGEVPLGGGPDGGGSGMARSMCAPRVAAPPAAFVHADGQTRAGQGCVAAGCHLTGNTGAGATAFAFAGTAYTSLQGTTPAPGVTIRVFPRGGMNAVGSAVSDAAGNFIIRGTFAAFPYETDVTACGSTPKDIIPMVGTIVQSSANCSSSAACHGVPGNNAVYIP